MEQTLVTAQEITNQTEVYLLNKPKSPILPISSLPVLNNTLWGCNKGRVIIVAGRTAMGKTALMTQIAEDLGANKDRTIYLSLEMPLKELIARNFSRSQMIDNTELEHGNFDRHLEAFKRFKINTAENRVLYSEVLGATWKEIETIINNCEIKKPQCIIIDHINHIKTSGTNDKAIIDDYLTNIKAMAIKHNITFIIGAQINRLGQSDNNPMPELHHLKGTGRLEEIADLCLLLFWPFYYDRKKNFKDYQIIIAKNRYGRTGVHECDFLPQYSLFKEKNENHRIIRDTSESEERW